MVKKKNIPDYKTVLQNLSIINNQSTLLWAKARMLEPLYDFEAEADFMERLDAVTVFLKDHIQ